MQIPHIPLASIPHRPPAPLGDKQAHSPISPSLSSLDQAQIPNSKNLQARSSQPKLSTDEIKNKLNDFAEKGCDDSQVEGIVRLCNQLPAKQRPAYYELIAKSKFLPLNLKLTMWARLKNHSQGKDKHKEILDSIAKGLRKDNPNSKWASDLYNLMITVLKREQTALLLLPELERFLQVQAEQESYVTEYYIQVKNNKRQENEDEKNQELCTFLTRIFQQYPKVTKVFEYGKELYGDHKRLFLKQYASCQKLDTLSRIMAVCALQATVLDSENKACIQNECSDLALAICSDIEASGMNIETCPHAKNPYIVMQNNKKKLLDNILDLLKKTEAEKRLDAYLNTLLLKGSKA